MCEGKRPALTTLLPPVLCKGVHMKYLWVILLTGCTSISLTEKRITLMQIDETSRVSVKKVKGVPQVVYEKRF
jgi:hypothetical protein